MSNHESVPIGEAIRRARLEHGWSQNELSWRTHIDQAAISKYETGQLRPSWDRYLMLCEVFGWELPYLSAASGSGAEGSVESPCTPQTPAYLPRLNLLGVPT